MIIFSICMCSSKYILNDREMVLRNYVYINYIDITSTCLEYEMKFEMYYVDTI